MYGAPIVYYIYSHILNFENNDELIKKIISL